MPNHSVWTVIYFSLNAKKYSLGVSETLYFAYLHTEIMTDALSDDGSDINLDDSQEDVMTPAELIAKLEEVSRR